MITDISHILEFLPCHTPKIWIEAAARTENLPIILVDHANNELKAAQNALAIMGRYRSGQCWSSIRKEELDQNQRANQLKLLNQLSKLAREELRHYEQVLAIIARRNIAYSYLEAARYAGQLKKNVRTFEPARLVDTLIMGAFIEARSCERFAVLAPFLDSELKKFYYSLLKSESRHFESYLNLAEAIAGESIANRVLLFARAEQDAIESPDNMLRFHSGVPVQTHGIS